LHRSGILESFFTFRPCRHGSSRRRDPFTRRARRLSAVLKEQGTVVCQQTHARSITASIQIESAVCLAPRTRKKSRNETDNRVPARTSPTVNRRFTPYAATGRVPIDGRRVFERSRRTLAGLRPCVGVCRLGQQPGAH
jgi:hypothetical protein